MMKRSRGCLYIAIIVSLFLLIAVVAVSFIRGRSDKNQTIYPHDVMTQEDSTEGQTNISGLDAVADLSFERVSRTALKLIWSDDLDEKAEKYLVYRRSVLNDGEWEQIASVLSDGVTDMISHQYDDILPSDSIQQLEYRIDVVSHEQNTSQGIPIIASNLLACIDPGHYLNSSELTGEDLYGYGEGLFMLKLAKTLRETLLNGYGISCVLTRETDDISIGGYTNGDLDNSHISLRGEYAQGSDLFLSLHTNANQDDANGYPTCNQPLSINKTVVFVNKVAKNSQQYIQVANEIGQRLSTANYRLGLATMEHFVGASISEVHDWSDEFNDALNEPGAVCFRPGEHGDDYYGVLRGAALVGVPGLIVEHGFHTVAEIRRAAMESNLADKWSEADASGIAEAFGFYSIENTRR